MTEGDGMGAYIGRERLGVRIVCGRSNGRETERFHVPPLDRSGEVEVISSAKEVNSLRTRYRWVEVGGGRSAGCATANHHTTSLLTNNRGIF